MSLYPPPLDERIGHMLRRLASRVRVLEARTAGIDSGFPLMALPAVIDAGYTTGDPKVYLNGSPSLTGPYQVLASYTPAPGDAVLALPVPASRTYVILGKLT